MKSKTPIIIAVIVIVAAVLAASWWMLTRVSVNVNNGNTNVSANTSDNANADNTNADPVNENTNASVLTNDEIIMTGTVFLKGYKTPSESFGMLSGTGQEVGLGSYDAEKERFRPYIGDRITVTFEKICRSNRENCCRSLFDYCGIVKSWEAAK